MKRIRQDTPLAEILVVAAMLGGLVGFVVLLVSAYVLLSLDDPSAPGAGLVMFASFPIGIFTGLITSALIVAKGLRQRARE
ncbi:MAG: hypothetical protein U1F60_10175 [Planctomycetota bacterium]